MFLNSHYFLSIQWQGRRGKKNSAKISMQQRRQHAKHLQQDLRMAEKESLHNNTLESEQSVFVTPSPSLLPPWQPAFV